ncbi:DUF3037 domain-containing protein [Mitsuaria sp. 7]|uniref:DUF3037 domain-containing protein n=1 Tax=Mitsuaria sp. 7 TaxID=1658665 RepID=UPI00083595FA|nr:DUF3037 domain-containing protein [Mitsuaria sp. 7]
MNQLACCYALVRFMPHSDAEEFVNVGVVVACPQTGFFDFRLKTQNTKRVTDFFGLSPKIYVAAVLVMNGELHRVKEQLEHQPGGDVATRTRALFEGVTHPREAQVKFSKARVALADSPEAELDRLYKHYVDRTFASAT